MTILGLGEDDVRSLIEAAMLGFAGGWLQWGAARDPATKQTWWQAAAIGAVASIGALWLTPPTSPLVTIAQSLLVGFFGQAVIATLQARITAGIAKDRLAQAHAIAMQELRALQTARMPAAVAGQAAPPTPPSATEKSLEQILTITEGSR